MTVLINVIAPIAVFCIIILSHEVGHFLAAKLNGVYVYEFNLGMGPRLFGWKGKETKYNVRLLPIGGSVQMMGEDEVSDNPRSFTKKKLWQRASVLLAGPIMNFVTAILFFIILYMFVGVNSSANVIGGTIADSGAEIAGIQAGDVLVEINGIEIKEWNDISPAVAKSEAGSSLNIIVLRSGERMALIIEPKYDEETKRWLIGVIPATETAGFFKSIGLGFSESFLMTKGLIVGLFEVITGKVEGGLAGPVGVITMIGDAASMGWAMLLFFTAYISINLCIINLLPLPALDGGRLVFLLIEGVRGKPIAPEKEGMVHFIGFMLLLALIFFVTIKDITRLIGS